MALACRDDGGARDQRRHHTIQLLAALLLGALLMATQLMAALLMAALLL